VGRETLGATLIGRLPVEALMRPMMAVVMQPGGDGDPQFVSAVPVAEPEQFFLEGADEALDDDIAGRAPHGGERGRAASGCRARRRRRRCTAGR
jgi:hypothetical protein